jgi:hypothetical protein
MVTTNVHRSLLDFNPKAPLAKVGTLAAATHFRVDSPLIRPISDPPHPNGGEKDGTRPFRASFLS